ncbi:MAG: hypothetical protein JST26_00470 [Bacteroidetes bacterium]|nr:hypothetical protein [Bacteroidota bacterium]
MKTNNPFIDNMIEAQASAVNNFMDTTKKFQNAFASGNIMSEGQSIYKEWMDKQSSLYGGMQTNAGNAFASSENKAEEFFKNWYTQQMASLKQMTDFNQSIFSSFANYGKNANDYANNFTSMNSAWTNIYNGWMHALNTSYDTFSKSMSNPFNKDMFKNMFEGNQAYLKAQEVFQPMLKAIQSGDFSVDTWKNIYNTENYKHMTEQLFGSYFTNANMKDVYDNAMKQVQNFFTNQNNLGKEYYAQMQNMAHEFPNMFSGNFEKMKELYGNVNNVFGKTFEPLLKLVNPGKEKENVEETIALMDKLAEYSIKQSELQFHMYKTTQAALEQLAEQTKEKYKDLQNGNFTMPSSQELYNEFVKINEKLFTDLFASEEFSKVKGDALTLGMDVKKQFEKQFENIFGQYPVVFRSEIEELYKTIYDLKKHVKDLQTKLAMQNAASVELFDDEKTSKNKKK